MNCSSEGVICRILPYFRKNLLTIWQAVLNVPLQHCFRQWQKHGTCCLTSEGVYFEGLTATCNKYKHVFNNWLCSGSVGYFFCKCHDTETMKRSPLDVGDGSAQGPLFLLTVIFQSGLCQWSKICSCWRLLHCYCQQICMNRMTGGKYRRETCGGGQSMLLICMAWEMHKNGSVN
jgi:hypothetical protein